jgi:cell division protein FtsB
MPRLGRGPQVIAALLVLGVLGAMLVEPTRQLLLQKDRLSSVAQQLNGLESTNTKLEERIDRLKDPDFIEQKAREQAGLVRPGETLYVVVPPSADKLEAKREARKRAKQAAVPEPEPGLVESFLSFVGFI